MARFRSARNKLRFCRTGPYNLRLDVKHPEKNNLMRNVLLAGLALAALMPASVMAAGDPDAGKIKGYTCTGCHGIPGYKNVYPTYSVPKIGGQNAAYIEAALQAYQSGERKHPTMNLQSESLSGQDIADIAAWLASLNGENE